MAFDVELIKRNNIIQDAARITRNTNLSDKVRQDAQNRAANQYQKAQNIAVHSQ